MGYRQLTQAQRYQIHTRHGLGMSQRQIARELGVHSSTISRELRRNATASGYDPEQAQSLSDHRRRIAWSRRSAYPAIATVVDRMNAPASGSAIGRPPWCFWASTQERLRHQVLRLLVEFRIKLRRIAMCYDKLARSFLYRPLPTDRLFVQNLRLQG